MSPYILFSRFWEGLRRESSDKIRFCVSHDGPTDGVETFCLPCFMFKNKTKTMLLNRRGSNIMEPMLLHIGAHQIFFLHNRLFNQNYFFPFTSICCGKILNAKITAKICEKIYEKINGKHLKFLIL